MDVRRRLISILSLCRHMFAFSCLPLASRCQSRLVRTLRELEYPVVDDSE